MACIVTGRKEKIIYFLGYYDSTNTCTIINEYAECDLINNELSCRQGACLWGFNELCYNYGKAPCEYYEAKNCHWNNKCNIIFL